MRLSTGYFEETNDVSVFNSEWLRALKSIIKVIVKEQKTLEKANTHELFHFAGPDNKPHPAFRLKGYGYPGKKCGLVRGVNRPSDDESVFPYLIPANTMAVVGLRGVANILDNLKNKTLASKCRLLADEIQNGINGYGIIEHKEFGKIIAFEVDGFGSYCLMDDPNIPSLLSLVF